nr:translation factor sui1 [Cryptomonas paramecium]
MSKIVNSTIQIKCEAKDKYNNKNFKKKTNNVHIYTQQRNGKKILTIIQGLDQRLDFEKIVQILKRKFCCNGCVVESLDFGLVIQLQGDQKNKVSFFLIDQQITLPKVIKIHGT